MQYIVISRFPPPIGGVSVFAQRKVADLRQSGHIVKIINFNDLHWVISLFYMALTLRRATFLINTLNPLPLVFLYVFGLLSRCCIYDHNASRHCYNSIIKKKALLFFAKRAGHVLVVHDHLQPFYTSNGVVTHVESPFLPPDMDQYHKIIKTYPESLLEFIDSSEYFVMLNSAWRYVTCPDGSDLYGIDASLKLLKCLLDKGKSVRLILAFGEYNRKDFPSDLLDEIDSLVREGNLFIMDGQRELWPLFRHVDLFLRTTATDGESVSVLESIHFGCPVVASDVVKRPQGVITYEYKNMNVLVGAVCRVFDSHKRVL